MHISKMKADLFIVLCVEYELTLNYKKLVMRAFVDFLGKMSLVKFYFAYKNPGIKNWAGWGAEGARGIRGEGKSENSIKSV